MNEHNMDEPELALEPLHVRQIKHIAASLQGSQQQSDSVTWVPETVPTFVQQAVQKALEATATFQGKLPTDTACCLETGSMLTVSLGKHILNSAEWWPAQCAQLLS